ncbi:MAG TPA: DNA alkylation repair protein [Polyangiaceae bacterium LLY-WYZ-15_(1-7)]|nr:DNA alkylation repair protein [Polyangiaceae bacterium LLY-WYZ-15_(1-7)]HJL02360.1 DNA alkylation repair protein [Polyangiaceae bacterium LLY-WYZ-15_(1-7)]HJL08780.1 DNA alkylation repair protein [Polyangiaceae bacterium LLY-WYZ-15_(1-7)]HJL22431.1 DNA alkylation repair protein [Polyangiaceae bacterium LLY-WYZ-15_(1-7)]HJL38631.1 DNA alkylation repair protein [Polyangiaceae bacterium LLY-WYZ-15_(1-7)]
MAADRALIDALRAALSAEACPENAEPMQRYVRSELPCWGVKTPLRRKRVKEVVDAHPLEGFAAWRDTIRTLWDEATHREERYAAIQLARARPYRRHIGPGALPLFEHLVVTGAWWDLVDEIASHLVGGALEADPEALAPELRRWARDPNVWKRRTAILAQLRRKEETDTALLEACLAPNLEPAPTEVRGCGAGRDAFWLRKATGWALRQYARTDPDWVRAYLEEHADALSPLATREASKHL